MVQIALTSAGCDPSEVTVAAGPTKFQVTNTDAKAVTEFEILDGDRILGETENITPGLSGSFSLNLTTGTYSLYCPNGTTAERGTLHVTGEASLNGSATPAPLLDQAVTTYRQYLEDQTAILLDRTTEFVAIQHNGSADLLHPARHRRERLLGAGAHRRVIGPATFQRVYTPVLRRSARLWDRLRARLLRDGG